MIDNQDQEWTPEEIAFAQTTWWSVLGEEQQRALLELAQRIKNVVDAKRNITDFETDQPADLGPLFDAVEKLGAFYKIT